MTVKPQAASRGDVWWADIPGGKRRPILVLTRDPMGRILDSVVCAPITSRVRDLATEVKLGPESGLAHDSVANFDNTFLLPRSHLLKRLGSARPNQMTQACRALALAIGC